MIKIEHNNPDMLGIADAFRGMRNPYDSWDKSDSVFPEVRWVRQKDGSYTMEVVSSKLSIGPKDMSLACRLINGGSEHRKFLRMIHVQMDIVAPIYWWKEMDTYKVGTVANSCSTMHTLTKRSLKAEDFSFDQYGENEQLLVDQCQFLMDKYLETNDMAYWRRLIQFLPMSYNQRRTVDMDYETLLRIYFQRKDHKLPEWHEFCSWIRELPLMDEFIGAIEEKKMEEKK